MQDVDYLILGSGLSALSFAALMAKAGKKILILEAHEFPGGFGHTFIEKNKKFEYRFNAQFHYVWDCGEGDPVNLVLRKLGLAQEVSFVKYGEDGFDRMRIPGYALDIPSDTNLLIERLQHLFPHDKSKFVKFLDLTKRCARAIRRLRKPPGVSAISFAIKNISSLELLKYHKTSLQTVFDQFALPKAAQTLLANQWLDFLLPPNQLSFYAWCTLFDGYLRGAYYPKHHFEHVIQSLVKVIEENNGQIIYNQTITKILHLQKKITEVVTRDTNNPDRHSSYSGKTVICNMDPKFAAHLIGIEHFSPKLRKQLNYDYSYSNFVVYGAVEGINLRDYGFGSSNLFHSESLDLNSTFNAMYERMDYSNIAFGIATPSLVTADQTGCPPGQQLFELLTVANYSLFEHLKLRSAGDYNRAKLNIYHKMLDIIERDYVPGFRDHISFKMLGSPTTNVSYCWAPEGNSYGMNLTPQNMSLGKLTSATSFKNFYFCNASSGSPSFAKSFNNGAILYEDLTQDQILPMS